MGGALSRFEKEPKLSKSKASRTWLSKLLSTAWWVSRNIILAPFTTVSTLANRDRDSATQPPSVHQIGDEGLVKKNLVASRNMCALESQKILGHSRADMPNAAPPQCFERDNSTKDPWNHTTANPIDTMIASQLEQGFIEVILHDPTLNPPNASAIFYVTHHTPADDLEHYACAFFVAASDPEHANIVTSKMGANLDQILLHFCSHDSEECGGAKMSQGLIVLHVEFVRPRPIDGLIETWLPSPLPFVDANTGDPEVVPRCAMDDPLRSIAREGDSPSDVQMECHSMQETDAQVTMPSTQSVTSVLRRQLSEKEKRDLRKATSFLAIANVVLVLLVMVMAVIIIWRTSDG